MFDDRETEATTVLSRVCPPKAVECAFALILGHPGAGIDYSEFNVVFVFANANQYRGPIRRMCDGVIHEVVKNLFRSARQRATNRVLWAFVGDGDPTLFGERSPILDSVKSENGKIYGHDIVRTTL